MRLLPGIFNSCSAPALAFALIGITAPIAVAAPPPDSPRDISAILEPIVAQKKIPGLAALVLRGDQVVAQGVAGVRKRGTNTPITLDDEFLLCSAGKAMTATLAAMAVEEGKLSWSTTVREILPGGSRGTHADWNSVTLAQLLQHRAGVPGDSLWTVLGPALANGSVADKRRAIVERALARPTAFPPGTRFNYSSVGYVVAAAMVEKVTNRSWEDLMRERLWQPLGIASGGFGSPGVPEKIIQPRGHWSMLVTGRPIAPNGVWARLSAPLFGGPAGTAHMTIGDWAKFISLHLRGDPANPNHATSSLLPAESFAALHATAQGKFYESGFFLWTESWANGHRAGDTGRVLGSIGDNGFWHCEAWLAPEIDFAVLVICNQGGVDKKPAASACREAGMALVREFAPKSAAVN